MGKRISQYNEACGVSKATFYRRLKEASERTVNMIEEPNSSIQNDNNTLIGSEIEVEREQVEDNILTIHNLTIHNTSNNEIRITNQINSIAHFDENSLTVALVALFIAGKFTKQSFEIIFQFLNILKLNYDIPSSFSVLKTRFFNLTHEISGENQAYCFNCNAIKQLRTKKSNKCPDCSKRFFFS